ncbi:MAG: substrate-binding domain-containing protein, partial [Chloroflexota bacterium]|nr:substrate-binding domain-containing protein [Chloroflexota bacterium]
MTAAVDAALARNPELSAIFACNDAFAIESMHALERIGRRVPDDVSVMGFDDIVPAGQVRPGLTTMAVDKVSMGRLAVLMLDHRLAWPEATASMTLLRPELRVRESVRALAISPCSDDDRDAGATRGPAGLVDIGTARMIATTTTTELQDMLAGTGDEKRRGDGSG